MRIIFFLASLLLFSCTSQNIDDEYVPIGFASVSSSKPELETEKLLDLTGNDYIGNYRVNMHTKNARYFLYSAVVEMRGKDNIFGRDTAKLLAINTFQGCFIPELIEYPDSTFYAKNKFSFDLVFDKRMGKALGNDHLYFSLHGSDLQDVGIPCNLSSYFVAGAEPKLHYENGPIPIFKASLSPKKDKREFDNQVWTKLEIGLIAYDCNDKIDFNAYFNSYAFKLNVAIPQPEEFVKKYLNLKDFLKEELVSDLAEFKE